MPDQSFKVYGYRWVVLAVFMAVNLAIQVLWITYAPITGPAALYMAYLTCRSACWR